MTSNKEHQAGESRSLEDTLALFPSRKNLARTVIERLRRYCTVPPGAAILEVGAAQGILVASLKDLGFEAVGVEPWAPARKTAVQLSKRLGTTLSIVDGAAESLPFESNRFDVVMASSVIEHVSDAQAAFDEAYRVLRVGGAFWFYTASSLCPRQGEIKGFPLFGWYPNSIKLRIMEWAKTHKPHLIGHTQAPAINWFTPWKARRMLRRAGFSRVLDRYDLLSPSKHGRLGRIVLWTIRSTWVTKLLAGVLRPGCSYAAFK